MEEKPFCEGSVMEKQCPVCNSPLEGGSAACPVCGYRTPNTTQSFEPIVLPQSESVTYPEKDSSHAYLRVIRGPQIEAVFALEGDSLQIGRDPQCDIFLNDMTVSRLHASIEQVGDGHVIRDENSFNGVWVNNENIEETLLREGDIIQIGTFCVQYHE